MRDSTPFDWQPQPDATRFVQSLLDEAVARCPAAQALALRLHEETGTRLFDWVDHLTLSAEADREAAFVDLGFDRIPAGDWQAGWRHPNAMLPTIVESGITDGYIAIKVESVVDALAAHGLSSTISGDAGAAVRCAGLSSEGEHPLLAVERHGYTGFEFFSSPSALVDRAQLESVAEIEKHREAFLLRRRAFDEPARGFEHSLQLIQAAAHDLGTDRTCDLFFAAERAYWQRHNHAARVQKARQDRLGLGWANHDHHTYRSSREHFHRLVAVLEQLGFTCRERFYAGREAGWGAQVLEQSHCGITVFADVDLAEDEVLEDFAHVPLKPRDELGTVGLWCKLHGEAFLEAGMHHLECQFDFDAAREQLATVGIETMAPFTDFPHLRQAFTVGEMWPVEPSRITAALANGWIDQTQANRFAAAGALGSHLEILERNDGYKGFNQTGISQIIRKTDPRQQVL